MELTEFKTKNSYYWLDIYGNPYKKCNKCGKIGGENSMCYSKSESFSFASFCIECRKEKDRLRMLNPLEKEKSKERAIKWYRKNGVIDIKTHLYNMSLNKKYPQTKIYIRVCPLTDKTFVTNNKNNYYKVGCDVKGEYKSERNCYLSIKKFGAKHICAHCNIEFDLRQQGKPYNISNSNVNKKPLAFLCSLNCRNKYKKQSITERARIRRARQKLGVIETIRPEQIYIRDKYKCWICGCKVISTYGKDNCYNKDAATLDHVIPLAKGGTHTKGNIKTACRQCNAIKSDKIIEGTQVNIFSYASI